MADRPVALVTAPFRGEGMDELGKVADVVYDPWLEHRPLRIYKAEDLAQRIDDEGADILIVESDSVKGPVFERTLQRDRERAGAIPTTSTSPRPPPRASRSLHAPGRNADAVAEMTLALLFAVNRWIVQADADVRSGQVYANGVIPYQRYRAWQLAGRTAGIVGLGAVGRADQVAPRGHRHAACSRSTRTTPQRRTTTLDAMLPECDVVSDARDGHARNDGHWSASNSSRR